MPPLQTVLHLLISSIRTPHSVSLSVHFNHNNGKPISSNSNTSIANKTPLDQILNYDNKSPTPLQNSCKNNSSPNPLKVPKAFKYPERYKSPTDQMVSPISKGLLARRRKVGPVFPPALTPPKIIEPCSQGLGLLQI